MGKDKALRQIDASMARVIESTASYSPPSGSPTSGDADTVDGYHASSTPVAGYLLTLNGSGVLPTSVYASALLLDGTRTLTGNLAVAAGITIDGVDISVHAAATAYAAHAGVGTHTHQSAGAEGGKLDHGAALDGLGDDDHAQYLNTARHDLTARHTIGSVVPSAVPAVVLGTVAAAGDANSVIRSNATIVAFDATVPTTITPDAAAAAGVVAYAARRDHTHAIAAAAPSTNLSVSSTNAEGAGNDFARAAHTHTIDTSSNPGATASILATLADGYLQLVRLGLGVAPSYPLHVVGAARIDGDLTFVGAQQIVTTADSLTLAPAADLDLTPGGTARVRTTSGVRLQSDNYASQVTGWGISYSGDADFRYLFVDELHAKSFIADLEQALAGGQIISKSVAIIAQDFTAPAAGAAAYLWVEDLPGAPDMAVFQASDIVRVRTFTRAAGSLTIADCWGVVSAYSDGSGSEAGWQRWTFTRSAAPNAGSMAATTVVPKGQLALDYGVTGNGFYEVNAIDGSWGVNSPYAQIVTWTTHPATGQTVRSRYGNLKGIFNVANEYGLYAGDGVVDASKFLRISNEAIEGHNLPIKLYDGASVTVSLDPTAPSFALGATLPSAYATNTGVWMGKDGGVYKARIGDPAGHRLAWDGTDLWLYVDSSNYIKATGTSLQIYANATKVIDITNTPGILIGQAAASQSNVYITAGKIALRNNTTEKIVLNADGSASFEGVINIGASGGIFQGTGTFAAPTTALKIYNSGGTGLLEMWGSGTKQVYFHTDGTLRAGGGNVTLSSGGIQIAAGSADENALTFGGVSGKAMGVRASGDASSALLRLLVQASTNAIEVGLYSQIDFARSLNWVKAYSDQSQANSYIEFALNQGVGDSSPAAIRFTPSLYRFPNSFWIVGRNAANNADVNMWQVDANDRIVSGTGVAVHIEEKLYVGSTYADPGADSAIVQSVLGIATSNLKGHLRIQDTVALWEYSSGATGVLYLARNAYYAAGWKRLVADNEAVLLEFGNEGNAVFYHNTDANTLADSAITWDETLLLYKSGGVYIGATPADPGANNLRVQGTVRADGHFVASDGTSGVASSSFDVTIPGGGTLTVYVKSGLVTGWA